MGRRLRVALDCASELFIFGALLHVVRVAELSPYWALTVGFIVARGLNALDNARER